MKNIFKKTSIEDRFYLSSLPSQSVNDAQKFNESIRTHWSIENELHWVLDMSFREDESRYRKDNGVHNLAIVLKLALNILRLDKDLKGSIKVKRMRVGCNPEKHLPRVLNAAASRS